MDFIFTGTPTKREIMIYLRNRKYSLLNYPRLKREIIMKNKGKSKLDKINKENICFRNRNSKLRQDYKKLVKEKVFYKIMNFKWNTDILFNIGNPIDFLNYITKDETKEIFDNKTEEQNKLMIVDKTEAQLKGGIDKRQANFLDNKDNLMENREDEQKEKEVIETNSNLTQNKSIDFNIEHSDFNIEHSDFNIEHGDFNIEHSDFNIEHGDFNIQHSDFNIEIQESSILQNKLSFFDEISDEGSLKNRKIDISKIVSPTKSKDSKLFDKNVLNGSLFSFGNTSLSTQRKDNLKLITESSRNNVKQKILDLKNIKIDDKKQVDFTFTKVSKKPLQEINSNINKTKKNVDNYEKILVKNTKLNSGYKNIIIRYTDKLITNHINIRKNREQKVKFEFIENNIDIHNPASPLPIIKKSKFHNRSLGKNKHKEVVFIQNVDLSSFNLEDDF